MRRKASTSTSRTAGRTSRPSRSSPAAALAARDKGVNLVNIAQPYAKSGLELICPKDGPVKTEADFKGHTLGVWFFGNEYPFYAWMHKLGYPTEGGPDGVTVLKQSFDVQPLIQK